MSEREPTILGPDGRPIERPPEPAADELPGGAESETQPPELDISEIPPEVRFLFEDEARRSEQEDWSGQLARAIIQGAPDGEAYREPAKKLGLTDAEFDQKVKELTELSSEATAWLEGGTPEQRQAVLEATLGLVAEGGPLNRQLLETLVTKFKFSETRPDKPAHYQGAAGEVFCWPNFKTREVMLSPDLDPTDPELRHALAHEIAHLAESAINYDDEYQKLTQDRPPALDSYYVRAILDSITDEERGKDGERIKLQAAARERFAEDGALAFRAYSPEDFLVRRLERAREADLEAQFGDTKTAMEIIRILRDPNPERRGLPENKAKLAPLAELVAENAKLYRFFRQRTEAIEKMSRDELGAFIAQKRAQAVAPIEIVDTKGLTAKDKKEKKTSWLHLLMQIITLFFQGSGVMAEKK